MVTTPNYDLDVDTTLGGNNASDYVIPSQKAIKSYVDNNSGSTVDQTFDATSQAAQSGIAIAGELIKYPQLASDEDITGVYNFKGQKKIKFTQSSTSDKLGFTLYNNNNVEKGYLEYNPSNTVDSVPLMTLGNYATASAGLTHVGFRKYSSVSGSSGAYNLLAPLISDARTPFSLTTTYTNFYLPLGFTDGNTTVKTAKSGLVDISSLLPDVSNFVTNSSLATTLSSYATQSWVGQQGYITGITSSDVTNALGYTPYNSTNPDGYTSNVGTVTSVNNTSPDANGNVSVIIPVIDQTFDGTSTNGQSGVSIIDLLNTLYPVGSIYIGTMSICPLAALGVGTWTLVSVGKVLQGAGSGFEYIAGASVSASLPTLTAVSNGDHSHNRGTMNISGGPLTLGRFASSQTSTSGALKTTSGTSRSAGYYGSTTSYDAQVTLTASSNWTGSTNTTGAHTHDVEWSGHVGTTVQPDAYVVNIWERTA